MAMTELHRYTKDPMSHRIIEKRRRDRMNNCLADLSRLIPSSYLRKQGRGRIEKTEIIEMAIKHIRYLQSKLPSRFQTGEEHISPSESPPLDAKDDHNSACNTSRSYAEGYKDCFIEMLQFMVDVEGFFVGEGLCSRLLNHTQNAMDRMGHDIDLREHLPSDLLQPLNKHRRDSSLESEARSTLRNSRTTQKDPAPKINGHRSRALSQSDIRGIRITSDYDSEAEMHASGGSNSPNSSGNGSGSSQQHQIAPDNLGSATSSQLREMLQTPSNAWGRNYRPPQGTSNENDTHLKAEPKSSTVIRSASPTSTCIKENDTSTTLYSFKRTIKERFKEELRRTSDPEVKIEEGPLLLGKRRPDSRSSGSNESMDGAGSFDSFPPEFVATAHKRRASGSPAVLSGSSTVPIFALHSSGAFYVPSTISINAIEFDTETMKSTHSICHPVTINVNFSLTATTHTSQGATSSVGSTTLHPSSAMAQFPRPVFFTPQQAASTFLQGQLPFMSGTTMGSLPFVCSMPGTVQNSTVIQSATSGGNMVMRRGSLPVTPASHREPILQPIQYAFPNTTLAPPPANPNTSRTSPHILNLSQPHTRL